jgi:hypothetical protein
VFAFEKDILSLEWEKCLVCGMFTLEIGIEVNKGVRLRLLYSLEIEVVGRIRSDIEALGREVRIESIR